MKRNEMPTNTKAYRGETLDDALAAARGELGEGVKVVSADRLRTVARWPCAHGPIVVQAFRFCAPCPGMA